MQRLASHRTLQKTYSTWWWFRATGAVQVVAQRRSSMRNSAKQTNDGASALRAPVDPSNSKAPLFG
jgi:hypothetical protein